MKFSEKIVRLRKIKGMTQDEFASAVGVSRQAVYKWESGQSYPEVPKLLEIKLLFEIKIDDLLDENYEIPLPERKKRKRERRKEAVREEKVEIASSNGADAEERVAFVGAQVNEEPVAEAKAEPSEQVTAEVKAEPIEEVKEEKEEVKEEAKEETAEKEDKEEKEEKKKGFFQRLFGRK